jgi:hypothetical protein
MLQYNGKSRIDKFLHVYYIEKFNQEDISNLNSSKACNEMEAIIESVPTKKIQDHRDPLLHSTTTLRQN